MALSVGSALNSYFTSYGSTLSPKLDKNSDNQWDAAEIDKYAGALKKVNGIEIDTESLIKSYDVDGDGMLGAKEQQNLLADDGLKISSLNSEGASETDAAEEEGSVSGNDWIKGLSGLQTAGLYRNTMLSEQLSSMLGSLNSGVSSFANGFANLINNQSAVNLYNMQSKYGAATTGTNFSLSL